MATRLLGAFNGPPTEAASAANLTDLLKTDEMEQKNFFDRLKDMQKELGNMFLFGTPTKQLLLIVLKLYHENILKNELYRHNNPHGNPVLPSFMVGMMEIAGVIYCTISSDVVANNTKYQEQINTLYTLCRCANIEIEFYISPSAEGSSLPSRKGAAKQPSSPVGATQSSTLSSDFPEGAQPTLLPQPYWRQLDSNELGPGPGPTIFSPDKFSSDSLVPLDSTTTHLTNIMLMDKPIASENQRLASVKSAETLTKKLQETEIRRGHEEAQRGLVNPKTATAEANIRDRLAAAKATVSREFDEFSAAPLQLPRLNYNRVLWGYPAKITLIHSEKYLAKKRDPNATSFQPVKKIKVTTNKSGSNTITFDCYNGSTCTESKLFGFLHLVLQKKFEDIDGMAIIWIGNDLPPNHTLPDYCYSSNANKHPEQLLQLEKLTDECSKILINRGNIGSVLSSDRDKLQIAKSLISSFVDPSVYTHFRKIMQNTAQQFCLPCPGCLSNYENYKMGTMQKWGHAGCFTTHIMPITNASSVVKAITTSVAAEGTGAAAAAAGTAYGGRYRKTKRRKLHNKRRTKRSKRVNRTRK
jgi:hypothetical protein